MTNLVRRTVTEIAEDGAPRGRPGESVDPVEWGDVLAGDDSADWVKVLARNESEATSSASGSLEDYRDSDAYVLLGAPGAGKSTLFEAEGECDGNHYLTAREFIAPRAEDVPPEWRNETLFIDGLDEKRAGSMDGRTPLDDIRARLIALGRPRFRLSCREADWFGANDRTHLETVSRDRTVKVLRLDPLSDDGIRDLLTHRPDVDDSDSFVEEARARGIDHLLTNPQNLNMLAKAVAGGAWPESRVQTFELACDKLVREPNPEHQIATEDRPGKSELLAAAGRLCAVLLLTGHTGYDEVGVGDDSEFLGLESIPGDDRTTLRLALRTRLFESRDNGEARTTPVHRQIAEFLGSRYVAELIDGGLPVRRVLALITGEDGGVVSELRGLSAWLAAHCPLARRALIERDPVGAAAYGDAAVFTQSEKRYLLECLWPVDPSLDARRFTSLATPDMTPVLREYLTAREPNNKHQELVLFLLCVLANATPLPELGDVLLDLAESEDRSPNSRYWAAICLGEGALALPAQYGSFVRRLLHDLRKGRIRDEGKRVLGELLRILYPTFLGPDEIFGYFDEEHERNRHIGDSLGPYEIFWRHGVAREGRPKDLVVVLESLEEIFERSEEWRVTGEPPASPLARTAGVLVRMVLGQTDDCDPGRTHRWLKLAGGDGGGDSRTARVIREWIEAQPERYKSLLREGVVQCRPSIDAQDSMRKAKRSLHGARVPSDYGGWCLTEIERAQNDGGLAEFWFEEAWYALLHGNGAEGLKLEHFEDVAASNPSLVPKFDSLRCTALDGCLAKMRRGEKLRAIERCQAPEKMFAEWRRLFIRQADALRENRCPPERLNTIAEAFLGHYVDVNGENGLERLRTFLGEDALVEAAVDGLRGAIHRDDMPTPEDVLALRVENQRHLLAFPVVAGLELMLPASVSALDDARAHAAVAMYLASRPSSPEPAWFRPTFESRPVIVAEEIVRFATTALRRGERQVTFVYEMLNNEWLSAVARIACPKLLRAFPVRAPQHHFDLLKRLLWWGAVNLERSELDPIVGKKLETKSMSTGQRAYWLAASLVIARKRNPAAVENFAERHANAMAGFVAFYARSRYRKRLLDRMPSRCLGRLANVFGTGRPPLTEAGSNQMDLGVSDFVRSLVETLATRTDDDAVSALTQLADDPRMADWHPDIRQSQQEQRVLRRDAQYELPDVEAVLRTLDRWQPANPADLAALTFDCLSEISRNIRHGNTSDWRQYWIRVDRNRPQHWTPQHEDDCRDALLSDLQAKLLPLGVEAAPEGRYADEKRSDIRVSFGGFNVPVELKKSSSRNLWSAIWNQLIAKYARDPAAGGYGIYLVFWFGNEPKPCQMPESGTLPRNAADLEERLRGMLTREEARLISVCVIDVSRP